MSVVTIQFHTDLLCIWAYVAERRVSELVQAFGDKIEIDPRFCSVFPDAHSKIEQNWKDRGGYEGFNRHLNEVAAKFPHVTVHDRLWLDTRPRTSASAHMFVKAIEAIEKDPQSGDSGTIPYLDRLSTRAASALRIAFFAQARDISDWHVHRDIASQIGMDYDTIQDRILSSEAVAALAADMNQAQAQGITGSPTFVMNGGRQRLFGNVGYRLLEANVQEFLRSDPGGEASWC